MNTTERIIICLNQDGTFKAASAQDFGGLPFPVSLKDLQNLGLGGAAEVHSLQEQIAYLRDIEAKDRACTDALAQLQTQLDQLTARAAALQQQLIQADTNYAQLETAFATYRTAAETAARQGLRVIDDPAIDPESTVAQLRTITTDILTPVEERARAAKLAELTQRKAAIEAELATLQTA